VVDIVIVSTTYIIEGEHYTLFNDGEDTLGKDIQMERRLRAIKNGCDREFVVIPQSIIQAGFKC